MDPQRRTRYLDRIGLAAAPEPTLEGLRRLQLAPLRAVPFENLDIHLGRFIALDPEAILDKVVDRRRGGFCYELNAAFAMLLEAVGFEVMMLEARVGSDEPGVAFDHLCLEVTAADDPRPHLVDVGFGAAFDAPLVMGTADDQADSGGVFRLVDRTDGWIELHRDDEMQYRLRRQARALGDFEPGCVHHQTSVESHFTEGPVCTLRTATGRVTVSTNLLIETVGRGDAKVRSELPLTTEDLGSVLFDRFGVQLGRTDVELLARADRPGWALFDSPIGRCGVAWRGTGLVAVSLPERSVAATARRLADAVDAGEDDPPVLVGAAIAAMVDLLSGRRRSLSDVRIDLSGVNDFDRAVYDIARAIPPGEVLTYGAVAKRLGQPGAAQAVGRALGRNPMPIVVPCHRVIAADGNLGGFSANGGVVTKRRLLEIEGAPVNRTLF